MTIDERIEALTQSLELLATLHTDLEKQTAARFAEAAAETAARFAETTAHIGKLTGLIEDLAHIAKDHQRIERLEQP